MDDFIQIEVNEVDQDMVNVEEIVDMVEEEHEDVVVVEQVVEVKVEEEVHNHKMVEM